MCACSLKELADSAFRDGLGPGFGVEVSWSPCIAEGVEEVVWVGYRLPVPRHRSVQLSYLEAQLLLDEVWLG